MKLLLTNDDGIDAEGLAALLTVCENVAQVCVVAPSGSLSSCGHSVTTSKELRVERRSSNVYSLNGSPADCVRIGLKYLYPQADVVISGINDGGNLGVDVFMSGTVAAAREAALLGHRAIAISQYHPVDLSLPWEAVARTASALFGRLIARLPPNGSFLNVNLPDPRRVRVSEDVVECPIDPSPLDVVYEETESGFLFRGDYHSRKRIVGHDVDVCLTEGRVTMTRFTLVE